MAGRKIRPTNPAAQSGEQDRQRERQAPVDGDQCRGIAADQHERRLAERDLAGITGQNVQPLHGDDGIEDAIGGADQVGTAPLRRGQDNEQANRQRDPLPRSPDDGHILFVTAIKIPCRASAAIE
jgi:hypothetical protein